ncbi:hypothetical protein LG047_17135 [Methylocystis sp. WRRC1]|uniref:hypothetical protein n=1 Tax=Methylocystis sp. WRRC1 TaxID=1732014 RepID=UPI001D14394B|nr:hypothetical protein [Methylocystis sp. WRRC1]MCC3247021.1 hypothetical protein [Methylocystis sp. WRRC1]
MEINAHGDLAHAGDYGAAIHRGVDGERKTVFAAHRKLMKKLNYVSLPRSSPRQFRHIPAIRIRVAETVC